MQELTGYLEIMAGRNPKNTVEDWIEIAQRTLIEEGVVGLKIDRLANRLGVTRGGFYHNFRDRDQLLDFVIQRWEKTCRFLPDKAPPSKPSAAVEWLDQAVDRLIEGNGYDYQFDMAVREWARSDKRAEWAIERADRDRIEALTKLFVAIGNDRQHASIRARVFYYHQIGYYAIGVKQSIADRRRNASLYLDILCGEEALNAARNGASRTREGASL